MPDFYNSVLKIYPSGLVVKLVCDKQIYNPHGLFNPRVTSPRAPCGLADEDNAAANLQRSISRAKTAIADIILANSFDLFITLTFDKQFVDRYSYGECIKKLNVFLDNRVRRRGLKYIIIPEHHKDGAIHFHGLCNDVFKLVDSGIRRNRRVVFNITDWKIGFTTAVRFDGAYEKVASYIKKYITKDSRKVGGRWYLSGGALARPELQYFNSDFNAELGDAFEISDGLLRFKRSVVSPCVDE